MRRTLCLAAALLAGGCATVPPALVEAPLAVRTAQAQFEISGRLSARRGEQAVHGRFSWQHTPGRDFWRFFSPLGQTVAELESDGALAELRAADGAVRRAPLAELLSQTLGADVPVAPLPRWVQAVIEDVAAIRELDPQGRPARLAEGGWEIAYRSYAADTPDARPRLVEFSRGEVSLKLVIEQWQ